MPLSCVIMYLVTDWINNVGYWIDWLVDWLSDWWIVGLTVRVE